jgi:hypothetical protein
MSALLDDMDELPATKESNTTLSWLLLYDSFSIAEGDTLGPFPSSNSVSANSSNIAVLEPDSSLCSTGLTTSNTKETILCGQTQGQGLYDGCPAL